MSLVNSLRKYRGMVLSGLFFFYLGCGLSMSFTKIDCTDAIITSSDIKYEENNELKNIEYVIIVLTTANNLQKRVTIRDMWWNLIKNIVIENGERFYRWNKNINVTKSLPNYIKPYFSIGLLGLSENKLLLLKQENQRNNDLLFLENFEDKYEKLAEKMLLSLKWLSENCKNLKYVIKTDDDSFVRVDKLIGELEAYGPNLQYSPYTHKDVFPPPYNGLYWGYFDGRATPKVRGKWSEKNWFISDKYLPYALGGGYVISASIVHYLANNAHLLSRYISEDVSMGVWTSALSNINRVHDPRFDTEWTTRGCQNDQLVRHKQAPADMERMWTALERSHGHRLCQSEVVERGYYVYNWTVPPSQCCQIIVSNKAT